MSLGVWGGYLSVCLSNWIISAWNCSSAVSTEVSVPYWGQAKTSTTLIVYSSTNSPSISPMTSRGTPALPRVFIDIVDSALAYRVLAFSVKLRKRYRQFQMNRMQVS